MHCSYNVIVQEESSIVSVQRFIFVFYVIAFCIVYYYFALFIIFNSVNYQTVGYLS